MKTSKDPLVYQEYDEDIKVVISSPASSTSTQQLLDSSGNKIGEVDFNTFEHFSYPTESFSSSIDRVMWGKEDTDLLLEKHTVYINQVGPRKRFQSKKHMWNQIANDIYAKFKLIITGVQCETRYKTISKRSKKQLLENTSKSNNSKSVDDEKASDEMAETESALNEGAKAYFERLEQTNQELTQQIEQFNIRILTVVEKLEKHHNRQQQRLEKAIQENKEQMKTDFSALLEKLDKIHSAVQQNQEQQQQFLEKLMQKKQEERKEDFVTLLSVLGKIHDSMKKEEKERCRSHSKTRRNSPRAPSPQTPAKKRSYSSRSRSPSNSKCGHKNLVSSHVSKRSRSNERYNYGSRSTTNTRNGQYSPRSSHSSRWSRRRNSKSRSPAASCNSRSCQEPSCKQQDKYR